jgi:PAS domain S-box-containing protein
MAGPLRRSRRLNVGRGACWARARMVNVLARLVRRENAKPYGIALLCAAGAAILRWAFDPWLGAQSPFITFLPAVALTLLWVGWRPAVAAAVLGLVFANSLSVLSGDENASVALQAAYVLGSGAIIGFGSWKPRGRRRGSGLRPGSSAKWMRAVIDHLADGLVTIDDAGRIRSFNPAAEELFGYSAKEVLNRNINLLMPDSYASGGSSYFTNYRQGRKSRASGIGRELAGRRRDGTMFPVRLAVSVLDSSDERYFIAIVRDISESKQVEEALQEAHRRKDEFLALLGHELRNPLAPLSAGLELMETTAFEPAVVTQVHAMMNRQLAHLVRLVDDLLDVSRISRGIVALKRQPLDLRAVIENAAELTAPFVAARRHQMVVNVEDRPLSIDGDFERLTQAIGNVLNNAVKYTEPGGTVSLHVAANEGDAVITVTDNGFGIPADQLPHIFRMFTQVPEHKTRTGGGGLGIGLALSRQLIALHGGTIEARSEGLGLGSTFTIRLPLTASSHTRPVPAPHVTEAIRRILVVDDNIDGAESLSMVLKLKGHQVDTAYDGSNALAAVERLKPEVVLLDIGLPEMSGYDVAKRIRGMPFGDEVQLIALTGWGQEEDKERSRAAGFDAHLTKPVELERLAKLLAEERIPS